MSNWKIGSIIVAAALALNIYVAGLTWTITGLICSGPVEDDRAEVVELGNTLDRCMDVASRQAMRLNERAPECEPCGELGPALFLGPDAMDVLGKSIDTIFLFDEGEW